MDKSTQDIPSAESFEKTLSHSKNDKPRKRGAPYGNTNAIKHGRHARKTNKPLLERVFAEIIAEFHDNMALFTERFIHCFHLAGRLNNMPEAHRLLEDLGHAYLSLHKMIETRLLIYPNDYLFVYALNQALIPDGEEEEDEELGVAFDRLPP